MSKQRPSRRGSHRSRSHPRGQRRTASHETSLAEELPPLEVPDHPLVPGGEPKYIDDPKDLTALVDQVREAGRFAYDTEFIGEESYYPQLCLIQIATADVLAVIDPMGGLDVTPVWELIADASLETIVHAGAQDMEPVWRLLGQPPANVFDTQIAVAFAGQPYPLSLQNIVKLALKLKLGKGLTFTRWDRRPLSPAHLRYAADDVRYLPAAAAWVHDQLEKRGHTHWANEECRAMCQPERLEFDPLARLPKLLGNRKFKPRNVLILRDLLMLRDRLAREQDLPPRTVLRDDVLTRLAKSPPKSIEQLRNVKHLPQPFVDHHGSELLEICQHPRPNAAEESPLRPLPEETPKDSLRIDALFQLAGAICAGREVAPTLVMGRRDMAAYYFESIRGQASNRPQDQAMLIRQGWRAELLGEWLEALTSGKTSVRFTWADRRLQVRCESVDES